MALSKPIIDTNRIAAFDATIGTTIYYNIIGGDLPNKNRITVIDSQSNICYQSNWTSTFNNYCVIPANASYSSRALTNGNSYFVYVETGDDDNVSPKSNQVQIYCYTTPTFEFTDAPSTVPSSTYTFEAAYSQEENELLNIYIFNLYNIEDVLIATSGELYAAQLSSVDGVYTLSYTFGGLLDGQTFKIGLQGVTVNNTKLTVEPQQFVVNYMQEETTGAINLVNNCKTGVVEVQSSLDVHSGIPTSDVSYINDKEANLRNNIVQWIDVETEEEFTIRVLFRAVNVEPNFYKKIMQLFDDNGNSIGVVQYRYTNFDNFVECILTIGDTTIESNKLYGIPNDLTKFVMQVRYANDEWSIAIGVYDQPSPTLYMDEDSNIYASYIGNTEPPIEYSLESTENSDNLIASYDDEVVEPTFNYNENTGDIKITI